MADLNTVSLIGRLCKDLEQPTKTKASQFVKFTIAVNGYSKEDVSFIPCQAWGVASTYLCKYAVKGDLLYVSGALKTYKTKEGGYGFVVNATNVGNYKKQSSHADMASSSFEDTDNSFYDEDDVPF